MSEWIPYNGDGQPVANGVLVEVKFRRDLFPAWDMTSTPAEVMRWTHKGYPGDIVAYRITGKDGANV